MTGAASRRAAGTGAGWLVDSERRPFLRRSVSGELVESLRAAASGEGVYAHFPVREDEKLNLAVAVSWADRVERRDAAYIAEMTRRPWP